MHIKRISLQNITTHANTVIELPRTGLVVVTGDNGAGKSSAFIEAVAMGLWGETVRGEVPWVEDAKSSITIDTYDGLQVTRSRSGNKTSLVVSGDTPYDTATKQQAALSSRLWPFDLWRRACVFSAQDGAALTNATPLQRARIIEDFVGVEGMDVALERCRKDLKAAETAARALCAHSTALVARLEDAKRRVARSREMLATLPLASLALAATEDLDTVALRETLTGLRLTLQEQIRAQSSREAQTRELKRRKALLASGSCDACGQRVAPGASAQLEADLKALAEAPLPAPNVRDEIATLEQKLQRAEGASMRRAVEAKQAEGLANTRRMAAEALETETGAVAKIEAELEETAIARQVADRQVDILDDAEAVLGPKGVRVNLLTQALDGLGALATYWLSRICGSRIGVKLTPDRATADGGVARQVSIEVQGVGGGRGFKATSGGERARINAAFMLGLAQMAEAAHNQPPGTLFADEAFDALDEDGQEAIAGVLAEAAGSRCVVVITHSPRLVQRLRGAQHLHVSHGRVDRIHGAA